MLDSQPEEEDDDDDEEEEEEEEDEEEDEEEADKGKVVRRTRRRGKNIETLLEAAAKEAKEEKEAAVRRAKEGRGGSADASVMILEEEEEEEEEEEVDRSVEVIDIATEESDDPEMTEESFRETRRDLTQSRRRERDLGEENQRLRERNSVLQRRCQDAARDLDSLAEDVTCPVCLTLPREPQSCPRGHSICLECRQQVRLCPTCRIPLLRDSNNFLLKKIIHEVLTHACRNDLKGCDIRVKMDDLAAHEDRCQYR